MYATRKLTQSDVDRHIADNDNAKFSDGENLYLFIKNGRGYFVHQFRDGDVIRKHSLGPASGDNAITLAKARRDRADFMARKRSGAPLDIRTRTAKGETFGDALATYLENHPEVPGPTQSLAAKYIPAEFRAKSVRAITAEDVAAILKGDDESDKPLWTGPGPNRGNRFRLLIEHVFAMKAINPNPAQWTSGALPHCFSKEEKARKATNNRPSMPYAELPAFMKTLADRIKDKSLSETIEDRAGRFVILTAARRKEALAAKWSEFDFVKRVWTVPGERMKMKRVHHVPLTRAMVDCLGEPGAPDEYVFQNATGGPLSNSHAALDKEWLPAPFTLHGFRSSFRTWATEKTDAKYEAREAALAHAKSDPNTGKVDKVAGAYDRAEMFDDRVPLMEAWSKFATGN
jgi:integrase